MGDCYFLLSAILCNESSRREKWLRIKEIITQQANSDDGMAGHIQPLIPGHQLGSESPDALPALVVPGSGIGRSEPTPGRCQCPRKKENACRAVVGWRVGLGLGRQTTAGLGQDILCWEAVLRCALHHPRRSPHCLSILSKMSRNEEVFSYFYLVSLWNVLSLLFIKILHFKISRFFNHAIFLSRRP